MKGRGFVRAALAAAAALGATAAAAQDMPQVPSPLKVETDVNGVNLLTGKVTMPMPVLGLPAAPRLRYDRVSNSAPHASGRVLKNSADSLATSSFAIQTGTGTSEAFQCVEVDCSSVNGSGSTLKVGMAPGVGATYREAGTGAVYRFTVKHVDTYGSTDRSMLYYVSTIDYPDGETLTYSYDSGILAGDPFGRTFYRTNRIASSLGYYLTLTYQPGAVGEAGWSNVAQATIYAAADPATPLARYTYSGNSITDLGNRTFTCDCPTVDGKQESTAGALTLPGEASPTYQVTRHPSADVVASVVKDGVAWSYSYLNLRFWAARNAWSWDRLTIDGPNGYHNVYDYGIVQGNGPMAATDSIGRTSAITYDESSRPKKIVYPELNSVEVGYDMWANIVSHTTTPKPNSGTPVSETAGSPGDGCLKVACYRVPWVRDSMGRQTDFVWNDSGQLTEQTDPADANGVRRKTYIEYEQVPYGISRKKTVRVCGLGTTCGTPNEIRIEYDYWGSTFLPVAERRIDAARGVTLTTTTTYDPAGRPLVVDGPLPGTDDAVYFRYDGYGRKIWEIGSKGANGFRNAKRFAYRDSDDKVVATEEGTVTDAASATLTVLTRTNVTYDSHRNPVREAVTGADGLTYGLTERSFDDRGQLICEARRMNPASFATATAACSLAAQGSQGPDRITRNEYDAAGQLLQVRRAVGTSLEQAYATYDYTANGKQRYVIDANGNRARMDYDGFDRQVAWIFPSGTPPSTFNPANATSALASAGAVNLGDYEAYAYDPAGNRTSLRKRDGTILTYAYDDVNRLIRKTVPTSATGAAGYSIFYGYDANGLQTYARFGSAAGPGVTNAYDGFGRLVSSATNMDGVTRTLTSTYDAGSNRIALNGDAGAWGYGAAFVFDPAGRLTGTIESGYPTTQIAYDAAGRRQSLGQGLGAMSSWATYGYDPVRRLAALTHDLAGAASDQALGFAYNPASQIVTRTSSNDAYAWVPPYNVSRSYAVNGLNQYTAVGGTGAAAYAYDANGNLTSDGSTSFVYDAENRLVSASGTKNAALAYDPLGRLWQMSSAATGTTRFFYDGDRLVMESNGAGTVLRAYVHGSGDDDPLVWYEAVPGGTSRRFLHADHQGSIVAVADQNGAPIAINSYDAWGVPGANNQGRFQYTGQAWLPELGMYYYKARIYWPTVGRFMQTDPVGYKDQINLYAYVGNDPVDGRDPTGQQSCADPKQPCPDIPLASEQDRARAAQVTTQYAKPGEENGTQIFRDATGNETIRTREAAGRAIPGEGGEFEHRIPRSMLPILKIVSHEHLEPLRTGNTLQDSSRSRSQNAPSEDDQKAMNKLKVPVQTVGPRVTSTLYRIDRVDRLHIDSGRRADLPSVSGQHIVVDDE